MKTLVKYLDPNSIVTLVAGKKRTSRFLAKRVVELGMGEHTVQEDGRTVHITNDQFNRLPKH